MISLAITLFVLGVTDLVLGGPAGEPAGSRRTNLLVTAGLGLAGGALFFVMTRDIVIAIAFFLVLGIGGFVWVDSRTTGRPARPVTGLTAIAITITIGAFVMPVFELGAQMTWIEGYLAKLPWTRVSGVAPGSAMLLIALILFLGPTSNGIVRTCLQAVHTTPVTESEKQLKGGRFIGPLERYLIFGLALAGEPTAAALIISAKSIIRFPELQSKRDAPPAASASINELTEYFLLGSLLSWSLALAASLSFS